jgi:hypothetical protein
MRLQPRDARGHVIGGIQFAPLREVPRSQRGNVLGSIGQVLEFGHGSFDDGTAAGQVQFCR